MTGSHTLLLGALFAIAQGTALQLASDRPVSAELGPGESIDALVTLRAGESADLAVLQQGVDVVVEAYGPDGTLLDSVDSPNGRQGDEPLSLFARRTGRYRLHIRPIAPNEPRGRIVARVVALRDAAQTRQLLSDRLRARAEAAEWLRRGDVALPADGAVPAEADLGSFDTLARAAQILGLGEATHGSREFNDFRLALVQRLVRLHGYRLIAIEDSTSRWRQLEPYVLGDASTTDAALEWAWIGRRTRRELLLWVRGWNLAHPADRVRIVGIDPQNNGAGRELLGAFLERAYGPRAAEAWRAQLAELATADEQTSVFGDSGTSATLRQFTQEIVAQLVHDAPLLRRRFGDADYDLALDAALEIAAFVDFNVGAGGGALTHSRDWYMALAVARAVARMPAPAKAIVWAHNAHVSASPTRWGPTGAVLRQAFGCGYRAIAATFGRGDFLAQIPNDPEDRLLVSSVGAPAEETVENVLARVRPGAHLTTWGCETPADQLPAWLRPERPLRWIGGLYAPDTPPSGSYQPYRLTVAFDGIAYFPVSRAETAPTDRPRVPARRRP